MLPDIDWTGLTAEELDTVRDALNAEIGRRHTLANAEQAVEDIGLAELAGDKIRRGDPWRQPVTVGYPRNWPVTHNGKTWESLIPNNVWEPGDPADPQSYRWWKDLTEPPADGQWNPNDHPYNVGDLVTFQSSKYRCRQAHRSQPGWTPTAVPALWEPVP